MREETRTSDILEEIRRYPVENRIHRIAAEILCFSVSPPVSGGRSEPSRFKYQIWD